MSSNRPQIGFFQVSQQLFIYIYALLPYVKKLRYRLHLPLFVITNLTHIFHSMHYDIKTSVTPTNVRFHSLCTFQLLSSYMFRHCRHLQKAYTKLSLQHTAINSLQYIFVVMSIVQTMVKIIMYIIYKVLLLKQW